MVDDRVRLPSEFLNRLFAGGTAGAVARTLVAPMDRVKILIQTARVTGSGDARITESIRGIVARDGFSGLWKGNGANCMRIVPHTATQFATFGMVRDLHMTKHEVVNRLLAGAAAGAASATVTQPLDVMRIRLQTEDSCKTFREAIIHIHKESGTRGLYKGYTATIMSLCPYLAINFAIFDTLSKKTETPNLPFPVRNMVLGAASGLVSQSICFPLDTMRRRMQVSGTHYSSVYNAFTSILRNEGPTGFYRGVVANTLKVVPSNAMRFCVVGLMGGLSKD